MDGPREKLRALGEDLNRGLLAEQIWDECDAIYRIQKAALSSTSETE